MKVYQLGINGMRHQQTQMTHLDKYPSQLIIFSFQYFDFVLPMGSYIHLYSLLSLTFILLLV